MFEHTCTHAYYMHTNIQNIQHNQNIQNIQNIQNLSTIYLIYLNKRIYIYIYLFMTYVYVYIYILFLTRIYTFVVCILTISHELVRVIILAPLSLSIYRYMCIYGYRIWCYDVLRINICIYTHTYIYICNIDIHYL